MSAFDLVLREASLCGTPALVDIGITGGRIEAVAPRLEGSGRTERRLGRRVVLPALVDPHHHLDKAFSLPETGVQEGIDGAVAAAAVLRARQTHQDLLDRGARLLDQAIAWGVGALRTHANVDAACGLLGVETALELRKRYSDRIEVQVVGFASRTVAPGTRGWDLLEEAARLGCHALGGSIGREDDPRPWLEALFALAVRTGLPLDLHVDEHTEARARGLEALIETTRGYGYRGRVLAAHCCSLSCLADKDRVRLIAGVVEAGITVVALPLTNLYLQGRGERPPGIRGLAPVRELLRAGARVICGSDNVGDAFLPYGNADPLLAALVLSIAGQLTNDQEREALGRMVTTDAAAALELAGYGLSPGARADLVVMDCRPPQDPVASLPRRWGVVHGGRPVKEVESWTTTLM